jgi:hypothetical protein
MRGGGGSAVQQVWVGLLPYVAALRVCLCVRAITDSVTALLWVLM